SLFEKLATYLAKVQKADFAVTIAEPHEIFHKLLETVTEASYDEDQNVFTNFLKAQLAKARIKNPIAVALAFQSLHEKIISSKVKLRYLKRNFAKRNLLTEKNNNALTSDVEQARAEDLLPNKIINKEKGEATNKEGEKAIGKDVINSEEDEAAEVKGETAEVEDEFDKEESVIESKKGETTDKDDEKESEAENVWNDSKNE
ncbi:1522_t:CDS:2, partial [Ambispora gerdemannii]